MDKIKEEIKVGEEFTYTTSDGHSGMVRNNVGADRKHLLSYLLAQVFKQEREKVERKEEA